MATREKRVVIEYEFKGYTPPDDWEGLDVAEVKVTHAAGTLPVNGHTLAEIRDTLEADGFTKREPIHKTRTHNGGRYRPTWREVWVKGEEIQEEVGVSWAALSPEADKARLEAAVRRAGWWPTLMRTSTKAIVARPRYGGRRKMRAFAARMAAELPGFHFNSKRNRWEADLAALPIAHKTLAPGGVNVSGGVQAYLEEVA